MIQYIGIHELDLNAEEQEILQHFIEKYGLHATRHAPQSEVFIHIKGHRHAQDAKYHNFTIKVRVVQPGSVIVAAMQSRDLRYGVHKVFHIIEERLFNQPSDHRRTKGTELCTAV